MVEIKDYDADSYELEFEEDTSPDDRKFFVQSFPNVDMVAERRIHCTSCNTHIGVAPANDSTIRMHPVLRVTHCKKCHTFYNSGEFEKGEDGSELYCRWCGQGGEVYCCSQCPYVFCKKCICQNLSRQVVTDITNNDNWTCFRCEPKIMLPLQAQHWALVNYIEKQKKKILEENTNEEDIYELMHKDRATCCKEKKARTKTGENKRKRKRVTSDSDDDDDNDSSRNTTPEPKRDKGNDGTATLPKLKQKPGPKSKKKNDLVGKSKPPKSKPIGASPGKDNNELVCTPDILSLLTQGGAGGNSKNSPQSNRMPSIAINASQKTSQPPPLVIRQYNSTTPTMPQSIINNQRYSSAVNAQRLVRPSAPPVYHTINGYRIDLNSAAQQETYRLPNGKLIQVKKQPTNAAALLNTQAQQRQILPNVIARATQQQQFQQQQQPTYATIRYNVQPVIQQQQQQQQNASALHLQHLQQQQQLLNGMGLSNVNISQPASTTMSNFMANRIANATAIQTVIQQQQQQQQTQQAVITTTNATTPAIPNLTKTVFPNTPLGKARGQLEGQVHTAHEICQHIVGKLNTFVISNAYKSVRNYNDVKELHLHLSYLFTYTMGRFKTLQDKCTENMKQLGAQADIANQQADKRRNYTSDDDDLEIVEPQKMVIDLDSDDEAATSSAARKKTPKKTTTVRSPSPQQMVIEPEITLMEVDSDDENEIPIPPPLVQISIETDPKLKSEAKVVLERIEDMNIISKSKLQQLLESSVMAANDEDVDESKNADTDKSASEIDEQDKSSENVEEKSTTDDTKNDDKIVDEVVDEENKTDKVKNDDDTAIENDPVNKENDIELNEDCDEKTVEEKSKDEDKKENNDKEENDDEPIGIDDSVEETDKETDKMPIDDSIAETDKETPIDDSVEELADKETDSIPIDNSSDETEEKEHDSSPIDDTINKTAEKESNSIPIDDSVGESEEKETDSIPIDDSVDETAEKIDDNVDESEKETDSIPMDDGIDESADKPNENSENTQENSNDQDDEVKNDDNQDDEINSDGHDQEDELKNDDHDHDDELKNDDHDEEENVDNSENLKTTEDVASPGESNSGDNFVDALTNNPEIDEETERKLLDELDDFNDGAKSDLENISSPDNFDDLSKNGFHDDNDEDDDGNKDSVALPNIDEILRDGLEALSN